MILTLASAKCRTKLEETVGIESLAAGVCQFSLFDLLTTVRIVSKVIN